MATYNGARWIETQLQSVLSQLGENDELVLVDDVSSDNTLERVGNSGTQEFACSAMSGIWEWT